VANAFQLKPGHVIFTVRVRGDQSTTRSDVEEKVIDWLADVLKVDASRRSAEGEWIVGAANPVTVIPLLGLTSRELADRETQLCQGGNQAFLGALPSGPTIGALVHLDWAGARVELPTQWTHRFEGGLLEKWVPTEPSQFSVALPDLAVTAECMQEERARPPIEPPGFFDDTHVPTGPDIEKRLHEVRDAMFVAAGVAGVGALFLFLWGRK